MGYIFAADSIHSNFSGWLRKRV